VKLVLENPGKFEKLPDGMTITRERRLQNLLRQMNASHEWIADKRVKKGPNAGWRKSERKERLPDEIYKRIVPWGSRAGVMFDENQQRRRTDQADYISMRHIQL
jgi:hypothetical protein